MNVYGAIEGGGTKFVCVLASGNQIIEESVIQTTDPQTTMKSVIDFFGNYQEKYGFLKAISLGCFGPIMLNPKSKNYGSILDTPKEKWNGFNIYRALKEKFNMPIFLDTDVNMAAMGEGIKGKCVGLSNYTYITVGTGIGVGVIVNKKPLHGLMHPEVGHMHVRRMPGDDYEGNCKFHKDCMEGLCSGPALEDRMGIPAYNVPKDNELWDTFSYYMGQFLVNISLTLSCERIVLGGSVLKQEHVLPKIRKHFKEIMNEYVAVEKLIQAETEYIVLTDLKPSAAIVGGLMTSKMISENKK